MELRAAAAPRRQRRRRSRLQSRSKRPVSELERRCHVPLPHWSVKTSTANRSARTRPSSPTTNPTILNDTVSQVNTDGAVLQAEINANALETTYHFEYGPEPCSIIACTSGPNGHAVRQPRAETGQPSAVGPEPGRNHLLPCGRRSTRAARRRVKTVNSRPMSLDSGATPAATLWSASRRAPRCCSTAVPTSWSRRPTRAATTSSPTWSPARSRFGLPGRPGPGPLRDAPRLDPRHRRQPDQPRRDPYIATRGADGWTTRYVGIPADGTTQVGAFGSTLLGADRLSSVFAFGGPDICDPCFADGSTNIPLRLADGSLVKGMAGSVEPGRRPDPAGREPLLRRRHATSSSARTRNSRRTATRQRLDLRPQPRDRRDPGRLDHARPADDDRRRDVGELDISADGSRIVVGKKVATDADGNDYWHLYMHIGTDGHGRPGAGHDHRRALRRHDLRRLQGLLHHEGQTGRRRHRRKRRPLPGGCRRRRRPAALTLLSTGTPPRWATTTPAIRSPTLTATTGTRSAAPRRTAAAWSRSPAAAGSPPRTAPSTSSAPRNSTANGTLDEPNLFVAARAQRRSFVATLEPTTRPSARRHDAETHRYGDFQVTPDGDFAVFNTDALADLVQHPRPHRDLPLRRRRRRSSSAPPARPAAPRRSRDTSLPGYGLSLTDDGRVFFTTAEPLVLRDTNEVKDAYEWTDGVVAADLDRLEPERLGPAHGQRATARTPSSSPARRSSTKTRTAAR